MRNLLLIIIETIICYGSMFYLTHKYKKEGIYIYTIIATVAACITCLKTISIMDISISLDLIIVTSLLIISNIYIETNKKEELKYLVGIIFLTILITGSFLNITGLLENSEFNNLNNNSYNNVFSSSINIYIALLLSIITSIFTGTRLYNYARIKQNKPITSNILAIVASTFIAAVIFIIISYSKEFNAISIILSIVFRYLITLIIGLVGSIPLYIEIKNSK